LSTSVESPSKRHFPSVWPESFGKTAKIGSKVNPPNLQLEEFSIIKIVKEHLKRTQFRVETCWANKARKNTIAFVGVFAKNHNINVTFKVLQNCHKISKFT
jgi:hypothetical protein